MRWQPISLITGFLASVLPFGINFTVTQPVIAEQPGMPVQFCTSNPDELSISVAYLATQKGAYDVSEVWTTNGWAKLPASDLGEERCTMVTLPLGASKYAYYVAVNLTESYFPNQKTNSRLCVNTSEPNFKIKNADIVECSGAPGLGYEFFSTPKTVGQVNLIKIK